MGLQEIYFNSFDQLPTSAVLIYIMYEQEFCISNRIINQKINYESEEVYMQYIARVGLIVYLIDQSNAGVKKNFSQEIYSPCFPTFSNLVPCKQ